MIVVWMFFALSDALRFPGRRRRGVGRRRFGRDAGAVRGIKFFPREVKPGTPFTLTFWAQWELPFNVTLGHAAPIDGGLDEFGNPHVDVPGLRPGRKKIVARLADGTEKFIGFVSVRGGFSWALTLNFSAALLLIIGLCVYWRVKSEERQKLKMRSDAGFDRRA
jgi:hypothetical protein